MLVAISVFAVVLLLVLTMALAKSAGEESRREEQTEMERWIKMKAAFDAERAKSENDK